MTLTDRELDVIDTLTAHPGWTNAQVGHALGMSEGNVDNRLGAVLKKYDAANRAEAIVKHARAKARRRRSTVAEGQLEAELTA